MESRLPQLFQIICFNNENTNLYSLSQKFHVTERTIANDIEKLNQYLVNNKLPLIKINNREIDYPKKISISFNDILEDKRELLFIDTDFRKKEIILEALTDIEHFNIAQLSVKFGMSRNTIINEIKNVRNILKNQGIQLLPISFSGYELHGNELAIRKLLVYLYPIAKLDIFEKEKLSIDKTIENIVTNIFKALHRKVSEASFNKVVAYFWATYQRINSKNYIATDFESKFESNQELKEIKKELLHHAEFENLLSYPQEISFLSKRIAEASLIDMNENTYDDWLFWSFIVIDFINFVSVKYDEPFFTKDEKLFKGLFTHLKPAVYRVRSKEELNNPLYTQVITKYFDLNNAVMKSLPELESKLNVGFSLQETTFLTLFFAASLERKETPIGHALKVIIVCNEGLSTSQILYSKLQRMFEFNILGTFSKREALQWIKNNYTDLIISTVDMKVTDIPFLKVDGMLSLNDISSIQKLVPVSIKEISVEDIMNIITKHTILSNYQEQQIYFDLKELLQNSNTENKIKKAGKSPMLSEVLTEGTIRTNYLAKNYEEAVRECGRLLVENHAATNHYTEAMLENVRINGNYIVIAPGIAMPHARPEEGALSVGFSLVTLAKPVTFGHPQNDPVSLVIGLCAVDNQTHLRALSELIEILSNNETVDRIKHAETPSEILNVMKEEK